MSSPNMQPSYDPRHLFPVPFVRGFTTCTEDDLPNVGHVSRVLLASIKPTKGKQEMTVTAPLSNGNSTSTAWRAFYPKGSINPSGAIKGGIGFYIGNFPTLQWEETTEILFSYAIYFEPGLGGKLPGPYGGATAEQAFGCSGGRSEGRDSCFSLRLMWREGGLGEIYAYLPLVPSNDEQLSKIPPFSRRNPDYGFSIGRGAWARLNRIGAHDGEIQVFVDGVSVIHATGVVLRERAETVFRGAHVQTSFWRIKLVSFRSAPYASPKDQSAYFGDVSGAVVA
ncbi:polysaccharide lyase family 14 protein [Hydnum rufescens UP504]|uniref:Polysaccharide lyase family 14 protein n=1 Tax=Hydnum rufescens UP504 TaxID=1448309 RepID=A0A9P6AVZ8_9AGAM|nr:polysaccharide lyase family 14 protein [Hydnum rufescens UP504]